MNNDTGILVGPAARFGWLISLKWRAEQERMANTITVTASPEAWRALLGGVLVAEIEHALREAGV